MAVPSPRLQRLMNDFEEAVRICDARKKNADILDSKVDINPSDKPSEKLPRAGKPKKPEQKGDRPNSDEEQS